MLNTQQKQLTSQQILNYVRKAKEEHFKNDEFLKGLTKTLHTKNDFALAAYLKKNFFSNN